MLVRITTSLVGSDFVRNPGDVVELPDAEAARLIDAAFAVPVAEPEESGLETADDPAAVPEETATKPKRTPRRKKGGS